MRAFLILAALALPLPAAAQTDERRAEAAAYIVQGERDWGNAFVTGDVATIDRLLAEDFIGIDTHGGRYDKARMRDWVRAGPNLTSDTVGPVDVTLYGDTAIARGSEHQIGPAPGKRPADRVWTDVWVRRDGKWQIVAATDVDPNLR